VRVWYHESQRVFADRLVNDEDRGWFSGLLSDRMSEDFNVSFQDVVTRDPLLYADFMTASSPAVESRPYLEITDHDKVHDLLMLL